jgi:hypothetical protein
MRNFADQSPVYIEHSSALYFIQQFVSLIPLALFGKFRSYAAGDFFGIAFLP